MKMLKNAVIIIFIGIIEIITITEVSQPENLLLTVFLVKIEMPE
jgi:hypothetical protein